MVLRRAFGHSLQPPRSRRRGLVQSLVQQARQRGKLRRLWACRLRHKPPGSKNSFKNARARCQSRLTVRVDS
jgi:hypothetical protein